MRKIIEFVLGLSISIILSWVVQKIIISTGITYNSYTVSGSIIIILSILIYLLLRKNYSYTAKGVLVGAGLIVVSMLFIYKINSTHWG